VDCQKAHAVIRKTWSWNEEVAEAVREKKKKYGNWKKRQIDRGMEGIQEE